MQKVAVVAHASKRDEMIACLHQEGVMHISELPDAAQVRSEDLPFHVAELDHVIAVLAPRATREVRAAAAASASEEEITTAGTHPAVRSTIDQIHALEHEHGMRKLEETELGHGRLPGAVAAGEVEEGVYFTSSVHENLSTIGSSHAANKKEDSVDPAVLEERQLLVTARLAEIEAELAQLSMHLPLLTRARRFALWSDQTTAARLALKHTKRTVTLFGWIAKHLFEPLERRLQDVSPATALLAVEPEPGEEAPVILRNPAILKPFESVTTLYGLPKATEIDPTPLLAPFFALFFGLCLTDAAYGLVLAIIMGMYVWKKKLSIDAAPLWWLLMIGGLVTFVVSIPFGGWFGMSADQAPAFMTEQRADGLMWFKGQIWNLGVTDGILFFQNLALALGVIHLSFGFYMAGHMKWRSGNKAEAFWVDWTTLLLLAACIGYFILPAAVQVYGLYVIYACVALVVWGKGYGSAWYLRPLLGLLGFLNLTMGMLSNTLSYLRLLALGLVTGALAMAVNLVAQQLGALFPPVVGVPVTIAIYLVGHTVNIALNVLGAFIHSGRLQFVEFFGNFFEGGGKPFSAFRRSLSPLS